MPGSAPRGKSAPVHEAAASPPGEGARAPWLQVSGLHWHSQRRLVLNDVSFDVGRGQIVGLLGANGSGKSSILRALLGLNDASVQRICLDGAPTTLGAAALRAECGVVQQAGSADGKLTVAENLWLGGQLYRMAKAPLRASIEAAMLRGQFADRAHERMERLSGGLKRRVELARAQLHGPKALLLDEPTQGLDAKAKQDFWQDVTAARRTRGLTVLLATHDASEAAHCDLLYLLRGGRVVHQGSVAQLLAQMSQDVLELTGPDPAAIEAAARAAGLTPAASDDGVVRLPCQQGHLVIPKLVEALGSAQLHAVNLRRASLADVFLALTGGPLAWPGGAPAAARGLAPPGEKHLAT